MSNFCSIITVLIGAGCIDWSGMQTVGEDCNFEALPTIVVITQILVPIVVGIPAMCLIPNIRQTEHLIDWAKEGWQPARIDEPEVSVLLTNDNDGIDVDDRSLTEEEHGGSHPRQ